MANFITGFRIACGVALLFCRAFSPAFFALYLLAGISDMIDGTVARLTHTASAFGARLDTAADCALVAACLIKLLPALALPAWAVLWTAAIALVKLGNIASGLIRHKGLAAPHTAANKAVGALLFCFPLTVSFIDLRISAFAVCAAATFAAVQEGHVIRSQAAPHSTQRRLRPGRAGDRMSAKGGDEP